MSNRLWARSLLAILCAVVVTATSGCSSLARKTAEAGFDAAKDAGEKWWNEGGKEKVQALAGDLATKAKDEAVSKAKSYVRKKSDDSKANLEAYLGKKLDGIGISDFPALLKEIKDKEKEGGAPYKPITGSTTIDIALAIYGAYLSARGTAAAANAVRNAASGKGSPPKPGGA